MILLVVIVIADESNRGTDAGVVIIVLGLLVYRDWRQSGFRSIYGCYTAIGNFETFDDSHLTAKMGLSGYANVLQGAHYRALVRAGAFVLRQRRQESGPLRHLNQQVGTEALMGFNGSSTSAEPPQKSPMIMEKVCSQQPGKPVSSLHSICPLPRRGDKRPGTYLRTTWSAKNPRIT